MLLQRHNQTYVRVMHKSSGGEKYGSHWFKYIYRKYRVMVVIPLKPKMGRVIGSFLDTWIGGNKAHTIEGYRVTAHGRVEWKGKRCVTNRGL